MLSFSCVCGSERGLEVLTVWFDVRQFCVVGVPEGSPECGLTVGPSDVVCVPDHRPEGGPSPVVCVPDVSFHHNKRMLIHICETSLSKSLLLRRLPLLVAVVHLLRRF